MDFQIRRAEQKDAPHISKIIRSLGYFSQIESDPLEVTLERVENHLKMCIENDSHSIYVAEDSKGKIVGYGSIHWLPYLILNGPEGYLSELFVDEASRGHGIGSQILEVIKAEARSRGCARLMLLNLQKRESYQRRFYSKNGWEEREGVANFIYQLTGRI